ncbi:conserved hypothetical protein [Bacillus sp. 349Y]|nr:conserved hypothetical protein [Bacillus sp. 349Y]
MEHDNGRKLVKQMRQILREMYGEKFEDVVEKLTNCHVLTSHSDISTRSGERIEVFVLDRNLEKELTQ